MPENPNLNYYRVLGVALEAEEVVIRAAYRALMQRYHPDKAPHSQHGERAERILAIQEAYKVLSDPVLRRQYDLGLGSASFGLPAGFKAWGAKIESGELEPGASAAQALEAQSWNALLHCYPQLQAHYSRLLQTDPDMAVEYKTFLVELIAERMVDRAIERISAQAGKAIDI